jgi:hypothetical protein
MTVEKIRDLLLTLPFKPFVVRTPDGKSFAVPHPEFAMLSGTGRLLHVSRYNSDHEDIIDIALITSVDLTVASES